MGEGSGAQVGSSIRSLKKQGRGLNPSFSLLVIILFPQIETSKDIKGKIYCVLQIETVKHLKGEGVHDAHAPKYNPGNVKLNSIPFLAC